MILTEYDEKKHMKAIRKEGYEDGLEAGRLEGLETGRLEGIEQGIERGIGKGMEQKLEEQIAKKLSKGKTVEMIAEELEEDMDVVNAILLKMKVHASEKR